MWVVKVAKPISKLVIDFCNLLWANLPREWIFNSILHQESIYIAIVVDKNGSAEKINRKYSLKNIENMKDDLWGLAKDCADEIINTANINEEK